MHVGLSVASERAGEQEEQVDVVESYGPGRSPMQEQELEVVSVIEEL